MYTTGSWYKANEKNGFCHCNCGTKTPLAQQSSIAKGHISGKPLRYITGHNARTKNPFFGKGNGGLGGVQHPGWKGGRKDERGYILIWVSKTHNMASMRSKAGYIREHRLIMAEHVGRSLHPHEVVHHKNGIKHDNRIENLEIMTAGEHDRLNLTQAFKALRYCEINNIDLSGVCGG